jgi:uncharacterized protein YqjF (DUF2071 family)
MWKHPVAMRTMFRTCVLVNFAFPPDVLRTLVPAALELDLYQGEGYVSVVIADMEKMRPSCLPKLFGVSYTQVVYRVVVRCGRERGVYFLRSDANNRLMCVLGDWFTSFRFHHARTRWQRDGAVLAFDLEPTARRDVASIHARYDLAAASSELRPSSAFRALPDATTFLV